jgi:putative membrane protein
MDYYNYLKSLHLIFVITWFAGLFYIVRLFVYQIELPKTIARKEILQAQYKMTYRLGTLSHGLLLYWQVCVLDAVFY